MTGIEEQASYLHVGIKVCNGGYVVHAQVKATSGEDEWAYTTSVFGDLDSLASFVRRVCSDLEGPPPQEREKQIGGLAVE